MLPAAWGRPRCEWLHPCTVFTTRRTIAKYVSGMHGSTSYILCNILVCKSSEPVKRLTPIHATPTQQSVVGCIAITTSAFLIYVCVCSERKSRLTRPESDRLCSACTSIDNGIPPVFCQIALLQDKDRRVCKFVFQFFSRSSHSRVETEGGPS